MPRLLILLTVLFVSNPVFAYVSDYPSVTDVYIRYAVKDGEVIHRRENAKLEVDEFGEAFLRFGNEKIEIGGADALQLLRTLDRVKERDGEYLRIANLDVRIENGIASVGVFEKGTKGLRYRDRVVGATSELVEAAESSQQARERVTQRIKKVRAELRRDISRRRWRQVLAAPLTVVPKKIRAAKNFLHYKVAPWAGPIAVLSAGISDTFFGTNLAESSMEYLKMGVESAQGAAGFEGGDPGKTVVTAAGATAGLWLGMGVLERFAPDTDGAYGASLLRRPTQPFFAHLTRPLLFGRNSHLNSLWEAATSDKTRKFFTYGMPAAYLTLTDILYGNGFLKNIGGLAESGYDLINKATVNAPSLGHFVGEAGLYGTGIYLGGRLLTHGVRRFTSNSEWQRDSDARALRRVGSAAGITLGLGALATLGLLAEAATTKEGDVPLSRYALKHYPEAVDANFRAPFVWGDGLLRKLNAGELDEALRLGDDPEKDSPAQAKIRQLVRSEFGSLEGFYEAVKSGVADGYSEIASLPTSCFNSAKSLVD